MGDVKAYLRKMDFPNVVPEALRHIQKLWLPDCSSQQLGLMTELSEEFVFFEIDKWGNKRLQKLPPIKELQIVERVAWYFRQPENDQKMATFMFLFPPGSKFLENRLPILEKLLSLAIATENGNVLTYIGTWMQICECVSTNSAFVANSVIHEHIKETKPSERMKNLPFISKVFCASLITSITHMFSSTCPSGHLVNIILDWIINVPTLCFSPFKLSIPKNFNFPGPQTPIPGLMSWSILSPLSNEYLSASGKNDEIFSLLHLSLLQCMTKFNPREHLRCESVSVSFMTGISESLKKVTLAPKDSLDKALDRFAMCVEVALSTTCMQPHRTSVGKLIHSLLNLPYNLPLKIIVYKWSSITSIVDGQK